jgi:hypothetical protein
VVDASGKYGVSTNGRKIKSATHGICPTCKELVRAEIEASTVPALLVAA